MLFSRSDNSLVHDVQSENQLNATLPMKATTDFDHQEINNVNDSMNASIAATGVDFHPIACLQCRQLHKKCDKQMPACSTCIRKGLECTYNIPKKRGKGSEAYPTKTNQEKRTKKRKENNNADVTTTASTIQPIQNNASSTPVSAKNSISNSTPSSLLKVGQISQQENSPLQVIDYYFCFLCQGHPLIPKAQIQQFVRNVLPELEKSMQRKPLEFEQIHPKDEEKRCLYAFYLATLTCYYQFTAQLSLSDETSKRAEREIAKLSIDFYRNFLFAGACHQMSIYYTGEGNMHRARYFLSLTNYYLSENKKRELTPLERNLKKHRVFISSDVDSSSMDTVGSFGFFLEKMPYLFELSSDKKLEDALPPGALEYVKEENVTSDNYLIYMQIIELVFNAIKSYKVELIRNMVDCHSEQFFKGQHLHGALIVEGIKFVFLSKIPEIAKNLMEEIALKISLMSEHELFQFANLGVSGSIMNVSAYHLEICKLIESGRRPRKSTLTTTSQKTLLLDYFAILKKDYKALSLLTRKYREGVYVI